MKIIIKVNENGELEIEYPNIGSECEELGRRVRELLAKRLKIKDEAVEEKTEVETRERIQI